MNAVIIIFLVISTLFALSTLCYVTAEIIVEKKNREELTEERQESVVVMAPVVEEAILEVMPEIVEHIDAEEADEMISDELALKTANYEKGAGHGRQGIINIGIINENFEAHDVITLSILKQKGLVPKNVGRIKVLADGMLNKPLTVKAENYSVQTIKMIELTGGTVIILKD